MLGRPDVTRGFGNCVSTVSAKGLRRQVKSECATTQFGAGGVTASLGAGALSKLSNQAHFLTTERPKSVPATSKLVTFQATQAMWSRQYRLSLEQVGSRATTPFRSTPTPQPHIRTHSLKRRSRPHTSEVVCVARSFMDLCSRRSESRFTCASAQCYVKK